MKDNFLFAPCLPLQLLTHISPLAELYTDESPGLKVDPVVVLVLSLVFIFSVVALHSKLYFPLPGLPHCTRFLRTGKTDLFYSHRQGHSPFFQLSSMLNIIDHRHASANLETSAASILALCVAIPRTIRTTLCQSAEARKLRKLGDSIRHREHVAGLGFSTWQHIQLWLDSNLSRWALKVVFVT